MVCLIAAKHLTHHANQLQRPGVANAIVDPVGVLACQQNALFAKDCKVLGNVALRSTHSVDDLLNASVLITDHTKNLEAQGMRYRLQRTCRLFDMLLLVDDAYPDRHVTPSPLLIII